MAEVPKAKAPRAASPNPAGPGRKMSDEDRREVIDTLKSKRLVIPEEGLKRIAEHKYVAGVYTPMDNVMNEYVWTPMSEYIPKGLAPNTITVSGLVIQILGYCVVAWYCPDFRSAAPRLAYLFAAFTVWAYQTLDALDGKQARRTGSSSPLGQLFDHGCDSVVLIFLSMLMGMSLHLGFSVRCVSLIGCMLLPFWVCQWTEYHTHSLPTNVAGLIGVTEAQFGSIMVCLANVYDTGFWNYQVGGSMPAWWCGHETCPIELSDYIVWINQLILVFSCSQCLFSVLSTVKRKGAAIIQMLPTFMIAGVGYAWCVMVSHAHPRLVFFTLGVKFSHISCQMIVAAMAHTEYPVFQWHLLPLPLIFVITSLGLLPRHEEVMLGSYAAISMYTFWKWIQDVIEEISQYIGIKTFTLGPRERPTASKDK